MSDVIYLIAFDSFLFSTRLYLEMKKEHNWIGEAEVLYVTFSFLIPIFSFLLHISHYVPILHIILFFTVLLTSPFVLLLLSIFRSVLSPLLALYYITALKSLIAHLHLLIFPTAILS